MSYNYKEIKDMSEQDIMGELEIILLEVIRINNDLTVGCMLDRAYKLFDIIVMAVDPCLIDEPVG